MKSSLQPFLACVYRLEFREFKMHRTFHSGQKWVNRRGSHNIFTQSKARQRSGCNLHHGGPASRDLPKRGL